VSVAGQEDTEAGQRIERLNLGIGGVAGGEREVERLPHGVRACVGMRGYARPRRDDKGSLRAAVR
jgi:hypothetical protein